VLYTHEKAHLTRYFGSIEVVTKTGKLVRLFFPIPRNCREQMANPLVKKEQMTMLEQVKRSRSVAISLTAEVGLHSDVELRKRKASGRTSMSGMLYIRVVL
jgi:hypothetical protein